jgi:hypothetical protein
MSGYNGRMLFFKYFSSLMAFISALLFMSNVQGLDVLESNPNLPMTFLVLAIDRHPLSFSSLGKGLELEVRWKGITCSSGATDHGRQIPTLVSSSSTSGNIRCKEGHRRLLATSLSCGII